MKLSLFGATGRTGRHIVEQALDAGHSIHALVRTPDELIPAPPGLTVLQGDIHDPVLVGQTVEGAEAVLSVLSQTRGPDQTIDVVEVGARHIVSAMQENQVRRLIFATGAGVRAAEDRPTVLGGVMAFLLRHLSRRVHEDAVRAIRLIQDSDLSGGPLSLLSRAVFSPVWPVFSV